MVAATLRGAVVCAACSAWIALASADSRDQAGRSPVVVGASAPAPVATSKPVDALLALRRAHRDGPLLVANDAAGRRIELSVVPALQERITRLFAQYQVPYGALVAIEPGTGRVLAYVSHSSANPNAVDLPL